MLPIRPRQPYLIKAAPQAAPRPASHRQSYARRTGAERTFSTTKDPATNRHRPRQIPAHRPDPDQRSWLTCLLAVRNQRILAAWDARQADDARHR